MDNILSYAVAIILECLIAYYFFSHTLECKKKSSYVIATHIFFYCILFAITFFQNAVVNLIAFLVFNIVLVQISYHTKWRTSIFYSIILTMTMVITELIAEFIPHSFFTKYEAPELANSTMLFCFIISKTLYFIFILAITHFLHPSPHVQSNIHLSAIIILSLVLIFSIVYIALRLPLDHTSEIILIISCSIVLTIMLIVLWLREYIEKKQTELFQINYDLQQERSSRNYFELVREQDVSQRILIHDFKNHLNIISNLCQDGDSSQALEYIKHLIDSPALSKPFKYTTNNNLNLILALYDNKCRQLGIRFAVDSQGADIDFMYAPDITSLFCNLLDNAVEAAHNSPDGFISIIIRRKNNVTYTISTTNSCIRPPIFEESGKLKTTKSDCSHHGLGCSSINKIVEKYNGHIHNYYNEDDMTFHSIILIYDFGNKVC